jgi:alkylhydroperoxidase/carboxymuconolactone decarboxylase family protein YurZ
VGKANDKLDFKLPDVKKAFTELHSAVFSDGKLTVRQKELIVVGISVAVSCSTTEVGSFRR